MLFFAFSRYVYKNRERPFQNRSIGFDSYVNIHGLESLKSAPHREDTV